MVLLRLIKRNRATALPEYAMILTIAAGAIALFSLYLQKTVQGKLKVMTDVAVGTAQEERLLPQSTLGGRQLANPGVLYDFSGVTNTDLAQLAAQSRFSSGMRQVIVQEQEERRSPGEGGPSGARFQLSPLDEYKFEDPEKKPYVVPKYIRPEEGYVTPP